MRGLLSRMSAWLRGDRLEVPAATRTDHDVTAEESVRIARALGDSLDRSMASGRWTRALRIASTAERLAPRWPHLTERLARLHLVHGRPETALGLIAACRTTTPSLLMLQAVSHLALGRTDRAHDDLMRAGRGDRFASEARRMLALIEWEQGDEHAATMELLRNLKYGEDPRTLELLMLMAVSQDRREQASVWARRLQQTSSLTEDPTWGALMRCSLHLDDARPRTVVRQEDINRLGEAIVAREQVIPALVTAQRVRPTRYIIAALAAAIEHVLPRLGNEPTALEALTCLALLANDRETAHRWIDRFFERCTPNENMVRLRRGLSRLPAGRPPGADVIGRIGVGATKATPTSTERAA